MRPRALGVVAMSLLLMACAQAAIDSDETTTEPSNTTIEDAGTTTTTPPSTTTTATASTTTTEAAASPQQFDFIEPFTIALPSDWTAGVEGESRAFYIEAPGGLGAFIAADPGVGVDAWVEQIVGLENLETTDPVATEVAGASGYTLDAKVDPAATDIQICDGLQCVIIVDEGGRYGWWVGEGLPNRFWIVDVDGTSVLIIAEAAVVGFDAFAAEFEEVLAGLEWGGG